MRSRDEGLSQARRLRVKMRKSHSEHFSTAVPQKADIAQRGWHGRKVPQAAVCNRSKIAPYSMTSSAVARSDAGTVSPSMRAVSALMTSSNFDACTTGKSAGFAPLRMRPT
jgi:hypothetical protein